ncbi:hypothetical protein AA0475_1727 [Acetobacter peroxydans]|nr:hypothetical protein AA13755_2100 [Acetobacter peroxydans NBRC 13755]GBR43136.1 hypothetical protein AA0475_1727 [Acetobacter peroxydans]
MGERVFMNDPVQLAGGDAGPDIIGDHIQRFGSQATRRAEPYKVFFCVDNDSGSACHVCLFAVSAKDAGRYKAAKMEILARNGNPLSAAVRLP